MMRFAVLADTHLASGQKDRFSALSWVLEDVRKQGIEKVFIAGDFCHSAPFPYSEVTDLFQRFADVEVYILLGNHDQDGGVLSEEFIGLDWVRVIDSPLLVDAQLPILLLPYQEDRFLPDVLCKKIREFSLRPEGFILISHADLMYGDVFYEDKGYFPITPSDLKRAGPKLTLLGHIHSPLDFPELNAYYCGSLCPISSNEWGLRRYGIFDDRGGLEWVVVKTGIFYWRESLFLLNREEIDRKVRDLVSSLGNRFSQREDWPSALKLSLRVVSVFALQEAEIREAFLDAGIDVDSVEIFRIDLRGSWAGLVEDFVHTVESLCEQENDDVHWGRWKDDIIEQGLIRFSEVVVRIQ